jgi:hypothetical protein
MKRIIAIATALTLTGCATYTNPMTGEQHYELDPNAGAVIGSALAVGVAAAAVGAASRYDARTPYMRVERCSTKYGCSTTRYYKRTW